MIVSKTLTFEASHQLQHDKGKCSRLHGHSWRLTVDIEGTRNSDGILVNYRDIKSELEPLIEGLDHWHLGYYSHSTTGANITSPIVLEYIDFVKNIDSPIELDSDFEPTSENLLHVIAWWIETHTLLKLQWHALHLAETCTTSATLTWNEYHEKGGQAHARKTVQQSREEVNGEGEEG